MNSPPNNVIILGGTGFIGQRLADHLKTCSADSNPQGARRVKSYSSQDCDLLQLPEVRRQLSEVNEATALVVCSGISRLAGDSWSLLQTNLTMIRNLVQALDGLRPHSIIFLSSTDVYGLPAAELPISETTVPQPTTYYGLAKLACERMFRLGWSPCCPITCLRLPGIYGPTDGGRSVVGKFCRQMSAGQPIQLSGGGKVVRDFVHVDDLCGLLESIIMAPVDATLNVATGSSLSILEITQEIARQLQVSSASRTSLIQSQPASSERDHDLIFATDRLAELVPAAGFRSLPAGIEHYLATMQPEPC